MSVLDFFIFMKSSSTTQNFTRSTIHHHLSAAVAQPCTDMCDEFRKTPSFPSVISMLLLGCPRVMEEAALSLLLTSSLKDLCFDFILGQNEKCFSTLSHQSREHVGRQPRVLLTLEVLLMEDWLGSLLSLAFCFQRLSSLAVPHLPLPLSLPPHFLNSSCQSS